MSSHPEVNLSAVLKLRKFLELYAVILITKGKTPKDLSNMVVFEIERSGYKDTMEKASVTFMDLVNILDSVDPLNMVREHE